MKKLVLGIISASLLVLHTSAFAQSNKEEIETVLTRTHICSNTLSLRSEALTKEQEESTCINLGIAEKKFHLIFGTENKPVPHDGNTSLRANIYLNSENYVKYATKHFNISTDNGGMYLEGIPDAPSNHAEFIAYQNKDGSIKNLGHEYVHYLDGRFNLYGDFCANLHDSHSAPENCAKPTPLAPYLVWWTEGIAEYISRDNNNSYAINLSKTKIYQLSQLFDTAYEHNNGRDRIYAWGYLATRFMMEKHREKIDQMLTFTRQGDFPRYQALIKSWGTTMDEEFLLWIDQLSK